MSISHNSALSLYLIRSISLPHFCAVLMFRRIFIHVPKILRVQLRNVIEHIFAFIFAVYAEEFAVCEYLAYGDSAYSEAYGARRAEVLERGHIKPLFVAVKRRFVEQRPRQRAAVCGPQLLGIRPNGQLPL